MDLVAQADWLVDVGPLAGERGGNVVYSGPVADYDADTPTANALAHRTLALADDPVPLLPPRPARINARSIDNLDVDFGLGQFTAVAGVSGSGKSTLVSTVLAGLLRQSATAVSDEEETEDKGWSVESTEGFDRVKRVVQITQKPIGRTRVPRWQPIPGFSIMCASSSPPPMRPSSASGRSRAFLTT